MTTPEQEASRIIKKLYTPKLTVSCNAPNGICTHYWKNACLQKNWFCENLQITRDKTK